jgi:hypothetical protein
MTHRRTLKATCDQMLGLRLTVSETASVAAVDVMDYGSHTHIHN